jgi:hypothetical protein
VKNLIQILLLPILLFSSASCTKTTAVEVKKSDSPQLIAKSPQQDRYIMEYKLCGATCPSQASKIETWGKPTEIGIAYYDNFLPSNVTAKPIASMDKRVIMGTYFVVKCQGVLPGSDKPLAVSRFVPVETYYNVMIQPAEPPNKPAKYGHIEIGSIEKIPNSTPMKNFQIEEIVVPQNNRYMVLPSRIRGYLSYNKNNPDIVPQQIETIKWQSGQTPQVIPVKIW